MMRTTNRRQFLKSAALALPALSALRVRAEGPAPSEKITLGCIGLGTHGGSYNLRNFRRGRCSISELWPTSNLRSFH